MRILIYRTFPNIINTDSYNVQEIGLAKALVRRGYECDIIFYNGKNRDEIKEYTFEYEGKAYSYKIYWLHGFNILKNGFMPGARKLFDKYDVIQVHEYEQLSSWYTYCHQPKPTIIYNGMYHSDFTRGYNLKCLFFDNIFFKRKRKSGIYKRIVCLNKSEPAAEFMRSKGFKKVYSVGVGLDADKFANTEAVQRQKKTRSDGIESNSERTDEDKSVISLLYVGKLEDRRSSLFLLDILDELLKRGNNVRLKIIGSGDKSYVDSFMKKAKPYIESGTLIYQEKDSQAELPDEYRQSDVFLFPSKYEIFGMVLLEAMYFGLPVISSYNGGSSVLIKDESDSKGQRNELSNTANGIIVKELSVSEWADSIEMLISNKERLKVIGENAANTISEHFLWDGLADKFIDAYEEAIESNQ